MNRILTGMVTAFYIAGAAYAQAPNAPLPNAPAATVVYSTGLRKDSATQTLAWNMPKSSPAVESPSSSPGDVSLYTIVDLALRNSKTVQMAEADQKRAMTAGMQTRDVYIPNLSVGSGLGYSYGFPLGNPTLFNVTSNFLLFSFSQRDYIRSARAAAKAATLSLKDIRRQVILDTALNYIELDKTLNEIQALQQALTDANKLVAVMDDRLHAGLESRMDLTQAKLTRAQIVLQRIHLEDHADQLRQHLSGLTGLEENTIAPSASSVPPLPSLDFQGLMSKDNEPPSVQAAFATADAKMFSAKGDKKAKNRPIIFGAFQYARFAGFNGYDKYYQPNTFIPNNVGIGIQATWPLFDRTRHDKAEESAAIAKHDREQAELAKIQNDEGNRKLWDSLRELKAQEQVADLRQQLAQDTLTSAVTRMNRGPISADETPIPPQEAVQDSIEERIHYVSLRDAQFNVTRVKLDLLSAVGGLEDWAKESPQPQTSLGVTHPDASPH